MGADIRKLSGIGMSISELEIYCSRGMSAGDLSRARPRLAPDLPRYPGGFDSRGVNCCWILGLGNPGKRDALVG